MVRLRLVKKVIKFIEKTKSSLIKKGVLHFDDCYYIAIKYIVNFPEISHLISQRFSFLFIDEMQDSEKFQIDILDKIFDTNESKTVIQRIGDINQSIYNSGKKVKVESDWRPRNPKFLNDSNRLTPEISKVVNSFTLEPQKDENGSPRFLVNGLRKLKTSIKPQLVLFNGITINQLETTFADLIKRFSLDKTPEAKKYGFKIIGWNAKWDDDEKSHGKLRLENLFPSYKKEATVSKESLNSLSKCLQFFDQDKKTFEPARKALLNALITVLRIEGITYPTKVRGKEVTRFYSLSELINEIKRRENESDYEFFKLKIFEWSLLMVNSQLEMTYDLIKQFILNEFKDWFKLNINSDTLSYLGESFQNVILESPKSNGTRLIFLNRLKV